MPPIVKGIIPVGQNCVFGISIKAGWFAHRVSLGDFQFYAPGGLEYLVEGGPEAFFRQGFFFERHAQDLAGFLLDRATAISRPRGQAPRQAVF